MALTYETFKAENIIFEDVKKVAFGDLKYQRIPIKYEEEDETGVKTGRKMDLYIATPELMSWGVQENRQQNTGAAAAVDKPADSYSLPLIMSDDNIIKVFESILEKCKEHLKLETTRKAVGKRMDAFAEEMDIFWRKKDGGEPVVGAPPTMYPKLLTAFEKSRNPANPPKISTMFREYNEKTDEETDIDPMTLIGKRCKVCAAIQVKDIYIGAKPSIQCKVNEVQVIEITQQHRRLLPVVKKPIVKSVFAISDDEESAPAPTEPSVQKINKFARRKP
jgi:hypothetical protein